MSHKILLNIASLLLIEIVLKSMAVNSATNVLTMESAKEMKLNAQVQEFALQVTLNVQTTHVLQEHICLVSAITLTIVQ